MLANYLAILQEEQAYLQKVITFLGDTIQKEQTNLSVQRRNVVAVRQDMWENTGHSARDFTKLTEMNQYYGEVKRLTAQYHDALQYVQKLQGVMDSPYFGRFDFREKSLDQREKIYVGLQTLINPETHDIYVYDWRAPISSIFYRCELGPCSYSSPQGVIAGEVLLKRQIKIQNSELKYFFDSSLKINDEILQEVLSRNTSEKMRNIVETIQKEQDLIIRDTENDLLMVQGVAGSGKTSIALHRVAFLLYEGLNRKLYSNNVIIISPNDLFNQYISQVLPELGEENIQQMTMDALNTDLLGDGFQIQSKEAHLEDLILQQHTSNHHLRISSRIFKGSTIFLTILERLLWHYAHRLIPFEDIYFNGVIIATRQQLKSRFLNNKTHLPMAKQLKRLEKTLLDKIHPMRKDRLQKIEAIVALSPDHQLEIKSFSRLLAMRLNHSLTAKIRRITEVDFCQMYQLLFSRKELFLSLAKDLPLPLDINEIIDSTKARLQQNQLAYEDQGALLYLKLRIEGVDRFSDIRQVVVDEAQDYSPVQYAIFKLLFKDAQFTVLGDIYQSIGSAPNPDLYHQVAEILHKDTTIKLTLNKSYRSSYEINSFAQKLMGNQQNLVSFERHGTDPLVISCTNQETLISTLVRDIRDFSQQDYNSIAVICKTFDQAQNLHRLLQEQVDVTLIRPGAAQKPSGVILLPAYVAKGLEFDVVLVPDTSAQNFHSDLDRQLLYIACTRATHRLHLYYTGLVAPFIPKDE